MPLLSLARFLHRLTQLLSLVQFPMQLPLPVPFQSRLTLLADK
jgi:hypothetical protein